MRPKPPCKDCTDRREGCHGVCLYYKAYRAKLDADSAARYDAKAANRDADRLQYERVVRCNKAKKRR